MGYKNKNGAQYGTVNIHLHNIYQKARVENGTALVARLYGRSSANTHDFMNAQPSQPGRDQASTFCCVALS
jgi:hypothetical protein